MFKINAFMATSVELWIDYIASPIPRGGFHGTLLFGRIPAASNIMILLCRASIHPNLTNLISLIEDILGLNSSNSTLY